VQNQDVNGKSIYGIRPYSNIEPNISSSTGRQSIIAGSWALAAIDFFIRFQCN
jgi:hypothetical protein